MRLALSTPVMTDFADVTLSRVVMSRGEEGEAIAGRKAALLFICLETDTDFFPEDNGIQCKKRLWTRD